LTSPDDLIMLFVMSRMEDTKGRPITKKIIKRSMILSLIGGGFGGVWFLLNAPQQILIILIKNNLGATSSQLGLFLGILNIASLVHLAAIFIYAKSRAIKPLWLIMGFIHRSFSFLIAASSFALARGGNQRIFLYVIMASSIMTFLLGNTAGSGWWAWMNDIIPERNRANYFGKRSSLTQALNIITFFAATYALDYFSSHTFAVFGIIYTVSGVFGLTEFILHIPVPEPRSVQLNRSKMRASLFVKPFKDKNFRTLCIVAGVSLLGINISAPFFVPMITDPKQIGAPVVWLGVIFAISQLVWVVVIPFWGTMMDRFGRKSVVMVGMIFPISFIGYIFLTPQNYVFILPVIAFFGGLFAPALYEGLSQIMLSLIPQKDRTVYIAWYWALLGSIQAIGPIIGGYLLENTGSISVLIFSTLGVMIISFLLFDTIKTGKELKFRRLVSTITSPGIIKAYFNIPTLGKSHNREKIGRALHEIKDTRGSIALDEIIIRLDDVDEDVREGAVRALGRIGGEDASKVLIDSLSDMNSLVQVDCARALGKLRIQEAVPFLIESLRSNDEKLVDASARALGKINSPESTAALMGMLKSDKSLRIKTTSAEGMSEREERITVLQEILELRDQTENLIIKKQLSIAIANILGKPGEFYQFLTGTELAREESVQHLFKDIRKQLKGLSRTPAETIRFVLQHTLPNAINYYETNDRKLAFWELRALLIHLLSRHMDFNGVVESFSETSLEKLYLQAPRLYAGYVVLKWIERKYADNYENVSETNLLLLFYAVKFYGTGDGGGGSTGKKVII